MNYIEAIQDPSGSSNEAIAEIKKFLSGHSDYYYATPLAKDEISGVFYETDLGEGFISEKYFDEYYQKTGGLAVNKGGRCEYTLLGIAAEAGKAGVVKWLIEEMDANVELGCTRGTPLCMAVENNHPEVVTYLISQGANIEGTLDGSTALELAIDLGQVETAKHLIANGADLKRKNKNNETPLEFAQRLINNLQAELSSDNSDVKKLTYLENIKSIVKLLMNPASTYPFSILTHVFFPYRGFPKPFSAESYDKKLVEEIGKSALKMVPSLSSETISLLLKVEGGLYTIGAYYLDIILGNKYFLPDSFFDRVYAQKVFEESKGYGGNICGRDTFRSQGEAIDTEAQFHLSQTNEEYIAEIKNIMREYSKIWLKISGYTFFYKHKNYELLAEALVDYNPQRYSHLLGLNELSDAINPIHLQRVGSAVVEALNENRIKNYLDQRLDNIIDVAHGLNDRTLAAYQSLFSVYKESKLSTIPNSVLLAFKNIFEKLDDKIFINGNVKKEVIKEIEARIPRLSFKKK